tara:strand:- start:3383 stop:3667 length:285 start_codon:yes stop_codon:yes gene_type:complete
VFISPIEMDQFRHRESGFSQPPMEVEAHGLGLGIPLNLQKLRVRALSDTVAIGLTRSGPGADALDVIRQETKHLPRPIKGLAIDVSRFIHWLYT